MLKMKTVKLLLIMLFVCSMFGIAQTSPTNPEDIATLNKIGQEAQNTRKYFSDEMTRQRTQIFKDFDDRAVYYENEFNNVITTAVLKLGLLWAGILIFFTSFNNYLRNRLEKKRYKKLKQNVKEEIVRELGLNPNMVSEMKQQEKQIIKSNEGYGVSADTLYQAPNQTMNYLFPQPMPQSPQMPHLSQMTPRKQRKAMKELRKLNKNYQFYATEKAKAEARLGIYEYPLHQQPMIPQQPLPVAPAPRYRQPEPEQEPRAEVIYNDDFQVNY